MPITLAPITTVNNIFSDAYDILKKGIKLTRDHLYSLTEAGIKDYYEKRLARYEKIHTLLSPHEPIKLEDIFVYPTLDYAGGTIKSQDIYDFIKSRRVLVVKGMAGQGKSLLLRHIFCNLTVGNGDLVPVFLELRDIDFDTENVDDAAYREIFSNYSEYPKGAFHNLLNAGRFLFLLDGLDEVNPRHRDKFLKNVDKFTKLFPTAYMIITSRPTDILDGWDISTHCNINDYERKEIEDLVARSPIDDKIKEKFLEKLRNSYYDTHSRFLSNPLLCNMMILTFIQGGDIPEQKHIFYKKAFDTLHLHHDNMKFLYKREYHSGLAEDVFVKLWRSFCYFSYVDYVTKFTKETIRVYIEKARLYNNVDASYGDLLSDFVESLCVIVRDGDRYVFLHRSFQEYAVSEFLVTEQIDNFVDVCDLLVCRSEDDSLNLAFSINQSLIENRYILEKIEQILKKVAPIRSVNKRIDLFISEISVEDLDGDGQFKLLFSMDSYRSRRYGHFLFFLRAKYALQYEGGLVSQLIDFLIQRRKIGNRGNDVSETGSSYKFSDALVD